jgi:hypothetical protein
LIEDAYRTGDAMGLPVWGTDHAGPYQTIPYPSQSWRPEGDPARLPHEYLRDGTAKALTLFRPADGLFAQGIMPPYPPVGGSWLNMVESLQRILTHRALGGQHPGQTDQIIAWFEVVALHWNETPTPFRCGGKRAARRQQRERHDRVGGSGLHPRLPA